MWRVVGGLEKECSAFVVCGEHSEIECLSDVGRFQKRWVSLHANKVEPVSATGTDSTYVAR